MFFSLLNNKKCYYSAAKCKVCNFVGVSTLRSRPGFPVALDLRIIYLNLKIKSLLDFFKNRGIQKGNALCRSPKRTKSLML